VRSHCDSATSILRASFQLPLRLRLNGCSSVPPAREAGGNDKNALRPRGLLPSFSSQSFCKCTHQKCSPCLFSSIQRIQPTLAAPIRNLTVLDTEIAPSWVEDPSGRGTWNLLYSCGFTLVLCVWTSIHLNVPPPHESAWTSWRRKLKWVVIALFAPEAVVFTAFQQWLTAKCFLKELKKIAAATPSKNSEVWWFLIFEVRSDERMAGKCSSS